MRRVTVPFLVLLLMITASSCAGDKPEIIGSAPDVEGMAFVKGGKYSPRIDRERVNTVVQSFYLDKKPVTITQFAEFLQATGYKPVSEYPDVYSLVYSPVEPTEAKDSRQETVFKFETCMGSDVIESKNVDWRYDERGNLRDTVDWDYPVLYVAQVDARAYAEWAGKRLPTMYEWQYAAEKGMGRQIKPLHLLFRTWNVRTTDRVERAGYKAPDKLGLYDMLGNISEHVEIGNHEREYELLPGDITIENLARIPHSSFDMTPKKLWPIIFTFSHKWSTGYDNGFRCAMDIPIQK